MSDKAAIAAEKLTQRLRDQGDRFETVGGTEMMRVEVWAVQFAVAELRRIVGDGTPGPAREAAPRLAVCPCTLVEPCSRNCTCANSVMSGGCARCCTYGSREQQLAAARHLAGDGTPGPAPGVAPGPSEVAVTAAVNVLVEYVPDLEVRRVREAVRAAWRADAALRAELARAPNVWEEAAKIAEAFVGSGNEERDDCAHAIASGFRARADAELGRAGTSEPSERERALTAALQNLISAHDGYRHGVGPCICAAHEDARAIQADAERPPQETK